VRKVCDEIKTPRVRTGKTPAPRSHQDTEEEEQHSRTVPPVKNGAGARPGQTFSVQCYRGRSTPPHRKRGGKTVAAFSRAARTRGGCVACTQGTSSLPLSMWREGGPGVSWTEGLGRGAAGTEVRSGGKNHRHRAAELSARVFPAGEGTSRRDTRVDGTAAAHGAGRGGRGVVAEAPVSLPWRTATGLPPLRPPERSTVLRRMSHEGALHRLGPCTVLPPPLRGSCCCS